MTSRWTRSAPAAGHAAHGVREVPEVGVEDARGDARPPGATPASGVSLVIPRRRARPAPAPRCARHAGRRRWPARAARAGARRRAPVGSPARSAASWPHAAPTSWPRLRRIVVPIPASRQDGREGLDDRHRAGLPRRVGDRVHRDEVDVGVVAAQQVGEGLRIEVRVVHAADHRVLVADPPAGRAGVVAGRVDDLGDRPAPVERHEHVAQGVARRVERDRQRELRPERREPADAGHDAGRGDRDVPRPQAEALRVVERLDRREHPVEVQQRLAHAHEHDVGQPLAVRSRGGARRGGPGRRSRRSRGRARSRARRWRRTGSRPRTRPGSRCTACAARARRRGPGSASGRISMSAPSSSRWRAFSVRPPSASRSSVSSTVSRRKSRASALRSGAGSVRISAASVTPPSFQMASAIWRARNDGSPCAVDPGRELVGGQAGEPRSRIGRHAVKASAGGSRARKHATADDRWLPAQEVAPRSSACRPAGCTSSKRRRSPSPTPSPRSSNVPAAGAAGRLGTRRPDDEPPDRRLDERAGPRLVGADLALQLDGRPASDRGGRPRGAAVGSASRPRSVCGRPRSSPPSHGPRLASSRSAATRSRSRLELRGGLGAVERDPRPGRRSGPCRARRPCASASPRSRRRRPGSSPGSGVAPRCRGSSDGWRLRAPCVGVQQLGGDDLAVVGEDEQLGLEREDVGDRLPARAGAPGSGPARCRARRRRRGRASE